MSPEEFFMYLTIGLIVVVPVSVRLYRYATARRTKQMLHEQFGQPEKQSQPAPKAADGRR